jgi:predicted RND superfamily exporter protein
MLYSELKDDLLRRTNTEIATVENLPQRIKVRYTNERNSSLLISVFSRKQIFDERNLRTFAAQMKTVAEDVTGGPIITFLFFNTMIERGRAATLYALLAIMFLLLIDFRTVTHTVLALIPLLAGACWMLGGMAAMGIQFSIDTFMVLPLILGIGIDDGVHILHRYRIEGAGSIPRVLRRTGRAVLLTSLTTMIAFGSMMFGSRRGPATAAQVLFMGVGLCFVSSAVVLPALITLYEKLSHKEGHSDD